MEAVIKDNAAKELETVELHATQSWIMFNKAKF